MFFARCSAARVRRLVFAGVLATSPSIHAADDRLSSSAGEIVIRPLAHASVQLEIGGRSIYVDPWSRADISSLPKSDLIIVTDADNGAHHLDPSAVQQLRAPGGVVVIPASGTEKVRDGTVMANGASKTFGNVTVEAIASYDLRPGEPFHAKGVANGYLLTIGDRRIYFAGVTECVPEMKALRNVDVAFMPMNLPNGRMTPAAVADCIRSFAPRIVYPYHYDQGYIARLAGRADAAGAETAAQSVRTLAQTLQGISEVRTGNWYPAR